MKKRADKRVLENRIRIVKLVMRVFLKKNTKDGIQQVQQTQHHQFPRYKMAKSKQDYSSLEKMQSRVNHRLSTSHHCYTVVKRKMPYKWGRNRKRACKIGKEIILLCYPTVQVKFHCLGFSWGFFQVFHLNHDWLGELCFQNDIGCLGMSAGELKPDYQSRKH